VRLVVPGALAAVVLIFIPGLLEQFEAAKAGLVRVVGIGCLALVLVSGAAPRTAPAGAGRARPPRPAGWSFLDLSVRAWLLIECLATLFSVSPYLSLVGEPYQREGLLTSLGLAGLYAAARRSTRTPRDADRTLLVWLAAVTLASSYALLQAAGLDPLHWTRTAVIGLGGPVRPFGTLGHPNLLGVAASAACCAALAGCMARPDRRWVLGPAAAVLGVTVVLTFSRAAWLALAVAAPMVVLAGAMGLEPRRRGRFLLLGGVTVGALLAVLLASGWGSFLSRRSAEIAPTAGSAASRIEIWRTAAGASADRPMLGHGPDAFALVFPRYQTASYWRHEWGGLTFHAHSIYLHTLATRGGLGLLAAAAWAAAWLVALVRLWKTGSRSLVIAVLGVMLTAAIAGVFGAIGISGAALLAVLSGTSAGLLQPARPIGAGAKWATAVAVAVLAVTCAWEWLELSGSRAAALARAWMRHDPARAVEFAQRAIALQPRQDAYLRAAIEAHEALARVTPAPAALREATRWARRAVAIEPRRALNQRALGRVLAARVIRGEDSLTAAALDAYERNQRLAPTDGYALAELARFQLAWNDPAAALSSARRAVSIYPEYGEARWIAGVALAWLGERAAARAELEKAVAGEWHENEPGQEAARRWLEAVAGSPGPAR